MQLDIEYNSCLNQHYMSFTRIKNKEQYALDKNRNAPSCKKSTLYSNAATIIYLRLGYNRKLCFPNLKVHKIENFFGSEFEFYTISFLVMLKY